MLPPPATELIAPATNAAPNAPANCINSPPMPTPFTPPRSATQESSSNSAHRSTTANQTKCEQISCLSAGAKPPMNRAPHGEGEHAAHHPNSFHNLPQSPRTTLQQDAARGFHPPCIPATGSPPPHPAPGGASTLPDTPRHGPENPYTATGCSLLYLSLPRRPLLTRPPQSPFTPAGQSLTSPVIDRHSEIFPSLLHCTPPQRGNHLQPTRVPHHRIGDSRCCPNSKPRNAQPSSFC